MKRILLFLSERGSQLYENFECKIVDSSYNSSFGGTGSITLANSKVMVCIWLDRDKLFADFSSAKKAKQTGWYSLDVVRRYLVSEIGTGELTIDNTRFMLDNFNGIESIFHEHNWEDTEKKLRSIEKERSKRLFG